MALSVSVAFYFKIHGRVTDKTMMMNAEVCSAVATIAGVIAVVRGRQAIDPDHLSDDPLFVFGTIVLVLLVPFDIWSLWSYLQKNKRRRQYLALFKTMDPHDTGYICLKKKQKANTSPPSPPAPSPPPPFPPPPSVRGNTNLARVHPQDVKHKKIVWKDRKWVDDETGTPSLLAGKSSKHPKKTLWNRNSHDLYSSVHLKNFPFKWLAKDNKEQISRKEYEEGFELVEAFLQFEAGICGPLCLLLRAKYLNEKEKQKTNTNISPPEISQPSVTPKCDPEKCDPETLQMGCSAVAAQGLRSVVGLDDDEVFGNMMKDPDLAIECEILFAGLGGHAHGGIDDIDNYYSVKFGESGDWKEEEVVIDDENGKAPIPQHVKNSVKTKKYHGGSFKKEDYDTGNNGKKLKDFHNDQASFWAGLFIYEVLVLRLYTSSTYRLFNGPMRGLVHPTVLTTDGQNPTVLTTDGQKSQHPLRFTIYALTEGVKKLRAVEAKGDEKGFNLTKELWRGMKKMVLDDTFELLGGTEMAVMSTTSDKEVALSYASSEYPLVFKYTTVGLTRGVKIQFLSLYPNEVEYVYPPLTFLSVVGKPYVESTQYGDVTIVQVVPQMS
jgi:hypothetical protein